MQSNFKLAVNHLMSLPKCPILLNGIPFEKVELFMHLGLVISSDLSWSNHITSLSSVLKAKGFWAYSIDSTTTMLRGMSSNFISHLSDHTWNTVVYTEGQEES